MSLVPSKTSPLVKAVRTLEGVLFAVATITPWVVSLINTNELSTANAAKWSTVSAIALGLSRTVIKAVTAAKSAGLTPESFDIEGLAQSVASKIGIDKLPSTSDIQKIVADAIKDAQDPANILKQLGLPSDAQEVAAPPPADQPTVETPPVPVGA